MLELKFRFAKRSSDLYFIPVQSCNICNPCLGCEIKVLSLLRLNKISSVQWKSKINFGGINSASSLCNLFRVSFLLRVTSLFRARVACTSARPGTPYFSFLSVLNPLHYKFKHPKGSEKIYADPLISQCTEPSGGLYHLNY